jgi:hypothetical protein
VKKCEKYTFHKFFNGNFKFLKISLNQFMKIFHEEIEKNREMKSVRLF